MDTNEQVYEQEMIMIEMLINDAAIGDAPTRFDVAMAEIAQAQARATLLLATQVKRVADVLHYEYEDKSCERERQERLDLYRST